MHGAGDALAYGVKVTGCTLFVVDAGVDTGPIVAQAAVPVEDDDTVESLHERIKVAERAMLVDAVGRMAREGFTDHRPHGPVRAVTRGGPMLAAHDWRRWGHHRGVPLRRGLASASNAWVPHRKSMSTMRSAPR